MFGFYALGVRAFFVLVCVVVLAALFEFVDALRQAGGAPSYAIALAGGSGMLLVAYSERPALFSVVVVATTLLALLWALRPGRGSRSAGDAAWTMLGVTWVAGGGAGAASIMMLSPGGLDLLMWFVATVAIGDIAAYFAGTAFGRHKLSPSISPGKSWEGFVAQVVGSLATGVAASLVLDELELVDGVAIGAIAGLIAPLGDLVESLFKREVGIKDSGRLLPGHGGFFDRLDAILFAAPAVYVYLRLVVY